MSQATEREAYLNKHLLKGHVGIGDDESICVQRSFADERKTTGHAFDAGYEAGQKSERKKQAQLKRIFGGLRRRKS